MALRNGVRACQGRFRMTLPDSPFYELPALLLVAAGIGFVALRLRQPLVVSFIAAGILVGPTGLDWVRSRDQIDLLARMGIALLLFVVGLKLDVRLVRSVGSVALATGLGQVLFTSILGFGLCLALGLGSVASVYVAVALTFSSTIIIVKLLTDKREIDSLHGRIAVGFLIVQDIVVVLTMILLVAWNAGQRDEMGAAEVVWTLARGFGLLSVFVFAMRLVLPRLVTGLATSAELLVLFAVAWAIAGAAASELLGFGKELEAFCAGVALASTPQRELLVGRLASLRDFLLLFFFIDLGARLQLGLLTGQATSAVVLSLFVLIGNPLIVMIIMGALGYRSRTGFLAGLTVAQISEFSLILGSLRVRLGHLEPAAMGLITLVGLVTIAGSTYLILYSHPLYERMEPWLRVFERRQPRAAEIAAESESAPVILIGLGRHGTHLAVELERRGHKTLGIDFDPEATAAWRASGRSARLGDATDPELVASLPLSGAEWVVSSLPDPETNRLLLAALRAEGFSGRVALTARTEEGVRELVEAGADAVLYSFGDAAREGAKRLYGQQASAESPAARS